MKILTINYNESDIESKENLSSDEQLEMHDLNNQVENVRTYDTENVSSDDDKSSEEEEASTDETASQLFNFSSTILFRLRKTLALIKRSLILQLFVFGEIKKQELKTNNLSSDFHVRWSSTFLMISKIITAEKVYNKITIDPGTIDGLSEGWKFVEILSYYLAPFFEATKLLSNRNFPSLSSAKFVQNMLMNFLENESSAKCFRSQSSSLVERKNIYWVRTSGFT